MDQHEAANKSCTQQTEASAQLHEPLAEEDVQKGDAKDEASEVEQHLHDCFRLTELPAMPLQEVARKAGRPARQISSQLLEAYGQLRCGLRLEYYTLAELLHILQQQCGRLGSITTLELANILDEERLLLGLSGSLQQGRQQEVQELVSAIPAAFPALQSLDLCGDSRSGAYADSAVALLAPLNSCLTALKLRIAPSALEAAPPAVPPFTCLRHLTVHMSDAMRTEKVGRWLEALASMPALVQLHLDSPAEPLSAGLWLPGLTQSTPQLTSLALGEIAGLDATVVSLLQRGLTGLKSLSLSLLDCDEGDLPVLGGVLPALAGRKGLTSLALGCTLEVWELRHPVPACLLLTDWTLDLSEHQGQQTVRWMLEALPSQTALMSLTVRLPGGASAVVAAEVLCSSLLAMPCTLVKLVIGCDYHGFDACSLMEGITRQLGLQELRLEDCDLKQWMQGAAAKLAAMTQLQVLRLEGSVIPGGFMEAVASLTQLRHLELSEVLQLQDACHGHLTDVCLSCLHPLQQLTCLVLDTPQAVRGPGMAVVRQLGALQELVLTQWPRALRQLHQWLFPLPPKLRMLALDNMLPSRRALELGGALLDTAKLHGCIVIGPQWKTTCGRVYLP